MNEINWLSMALASITPMAIGAIYYHNAVFGKTLTASLGGNLEALKRRNKILVYILSAVFSFLLAFFLLNFNNDGINQEGNFDNFQHGTWHGAFVAITVIIPVVVLSGLLKEESGKSILIHSIYWFITVMLMGGIVDAMNHWTNITLPDGIDLR